NIQKHNVAADTDQNDADRKDSSQFLRNRGENKVCRNNRNLVRKSLAESKAEPSSCADRKQRLRHLISPFIIDRERVSPNRYPRPHMRKQKICGYRSNTSGSHACRNIER